MCADKNGTSKYNIFWLISWSFWWIRGEHSGWVWHCVWFCCSLPGSWHCCNIILPIVSCIDVTHTISTYWSDFIVIYIQSSAVITRSSIVRYYRNWGRISIRCWIHKRHPITWSSYGVSFVNICEKIDHVITAPHCSMQNRAMTMVYCTCMFSTFLSRNCEFGFTYQWCLCWKICLVVVQSSPNIT